MLNTNMTHSKHARHQKPQTRGAQNMLNEINLTNCILKHCSNNAQQEHDMLEICFRYVARPCAVFGTRIIRRQNADPESVVTRLQAESL